MKIVRLTLCFLVTVMIIAVVFVSSPQAVRAQSCDPATDPACPTDTPGPTCGLPGLPDCATNPPQTDPPTALPPTKTPQPKPLATHTNTPTATNTATSTIVNTATSLPCVSGGSGMSARPECTTTPTPPCVSGGSGMSARPECTTTSTPPCNSGSSASAREQCTQVPTSKSQALLTSGDGSSPSNPNGLLPAVQNLGPLGGGLLAGLIVVIIGLGGFFLGRRKIKLGSTNGSDLLPAVQKGGLESDALINHEIGGTTRPPGPPIMPNDVLIPPGPPNTPSDVIKPPGPPVMPNNVLRPPGPPTMPSDVMQPPGPPVMPNESMKPPGPPTKPPNPNKGGGLKHQ